MVCSRQAARPGLGRDRRKLARAGPVEIACADRLEVDIQLDEQRIVSVPVLDVGSDIEEAEEDTDAVPAPLGPTTKGFEWSGGFGQSSRSSSTAGGYLEF